MILAAFPNLNDSVIPSTFLGGCTMKTSIQGRFPVLKAFITSMAVGAELPLPSNHCCPGRLRTHPPLLQAELPTPIRMDKGGGHSVLPEQGCVLAWLWNYHPSSCSVLWAHCCSAIDSSLKAGELFLIFFLVLQPGYVRMGQEVHAAGMPLTWRRGWLTASPCRLKVWKPLLHFFHRLNTDTW